MGLRKVHFKQNFLSFPYLETEVMTSSIFFPETYLYFGIPIHIFKELIFLNNFCKEKKLLPGLNRDDCEFLIFTNLLVIF
jgi:hypothetical protein